MKLRPVLAVLIFLLVIGVVSTIRIANFDNNYGAVSENSVANTDDNVSVIEGSPAENVEVSSGISLSSLSEHSSRDDCWIAYNGKVYDITSWLPAHPGGASRIAPYCGTSEEFQKAFEREHGTKQVSRLMKVGTLIGDFQIKGALS